MLKSFLLVHVTETFGENEMLFQDKTRWLRTIEECYSVCRKTSDCKVASWMTGTGTSRKSCGLLSSCKTRVRKRTTCRSSIRLYFIVDASVGIWALTKDIATAEKVCHSRGNSKLCLRVAWKANYLTFLVKGMHER